MGWKVGIGAGACGVQLRRGNEAGNGWHVLGSGRVSWCGTGICFEHTARAAVPTLVLRFAVCRFLQMTDVISRGAMLADVVTIIGTLDVVFGEIDR